MDNNVISELERISKYWESSARVKSEEKFDLHFDLDVKDFPYELLPFSKHEFWGVINERQKNILLSYGWILYNLKTIQIESKLITHSCIDILSLSKKTEVHASHINRSICESLTDEAYHVLLSVKGIDIVYQERKLHRISSPDFKLIKCLREMESSVNSEWQRKLIRLAFSSVSEVLVTDYLNLLSNDNNVQKICKEITHSHAMDEWMHSSVFTQIFKYIYSMLSIKEKKYLLSIIPFAIKSFTSNEIESWNSVFKTLNISTDILSCPELSKPMNINTNGIKQLLNAVDIDEKSEQFCIQ